MRKSLLLTLALLAPVMLEAACGGDSPPPPPPPLPPPGGTISIQYDSPLSVTDSLQVNGMILPAGPWVTGLCPTVMGADVLSCDVRLPAGATSVLLSVQAKGGGATTYSCTEKPCGSLTYQELGALSVKSGGAALTGALISNEQGCGCNHEFKLH